MNKKQPSSKEQSTGIQSLDAALRVLIAMSKIKGPISLSKLAAVVDMPVSKTHRYLASFLHAGLVQQSGPSGKYDLGAGAIEIGLAALNRHDFVNHTSIDIPALSADSGLTVMLSVWGNNGPTVIRWERAPSLVAASLGLGTSMPLLTSSTGRIFLSYLSGQLTGELVKKELRQARGAKQISPDLSFTQKSVKALTAQIRKQGFAAIDGGYIPGLVAISAPILDWQGQAQAAITLVGLDTKITLPNSRELVMLQQFCAAHSLPRTTTE